MKRVSFKVAKAIKEAGYPQYRDNRTVLYPTRGEFKGFLCGYNDTAPERDKDSINAPTYLEVWLWLWREKKIELQILGYNGKAKCYIERSSISEDFLTDMLDTEEAIIEGIEYLVENNLIK